MQSNVLSLKFEMEEKGVLPEELVAFIDEGSCIPQPNSSVMDIVKLDLKYSGSVVRGGHRTEALSMLHKEGRRMDEWLAVKLVNRGESRINFLTAMC
jgi:hypothetical protein